MNNTGASRIKIGYQTISNRSSAILLDKSSYPCILSIGVKGTTSNPFTYTIDTTQTDDFVIRFFSLTDTGTNNISEVSVARGSTLIILYTTI